MLALVQTKLWLLWIPALLGDLSCAGPAQCLDTPPGTFFSPVSCRVKTKDLLSCCKAAYMYSQGVSEPGDCNHAQKTGCEWGETARRGGWGPSHLHLMKI